MSLLSAAFSSFGMLLGSFKDRVDYVPIMFRNHYGIGYRQDKGDYLFIIAEK